MPLSYQRKTHRGEIHPVTLHPCKRQEKLYLTEQRPHIPWIHLPCSGLVRIWSLGRSQQLFFCVFSHFRHGHEQTNNQVILVQACPWPVWEGSLCNHCNKGNFNTSWRLSLNLVTFGHEREPVWHHYQSKYRSSEVERWRLVNPVLPNCMVLKRHLFDNIYESKTKKDKFDFDIWFKTIYERIRECNNERWQSKKGTPVQIQLEWQ